MHNQLPHAFMRSSCPGWFKESWIWTGLDYYGWPIGTLTISALLRRPSRSQMTSPISYLKRQRKILIIIIIIIITPNFMIVTLRNGLKKHIHPKVTESAILIKTVKIYLIIYFCIELVEF